ncbi:MAG: hypothetical protein NTV34_08605 [Proteobacteria bacterium]|nr:hypothetical protein [Pseudomonadota bacterium]
MVALLRNLLLNPITPIDHRNIIVQIDPFDERISIGKSKQDVFLPLTMTANLYKLFLTLMGSGSALINEVLDHCYGIKNYDPTIHDAKLAQLVTQANITLRAYFAFKRRRNTIVMTSLNGPFTVTSKGSWKHITAIYKYRERVWQTFSMTARAPCRTPEAAPKEVSPVKRVLTPGKWVAREEIEGFFGVSKATICRRISSWVKNGDLQKQGVGRRTVYLVNQEFLNNHAEKFVTH